MADRHREESASGGTAPPAHAPRVAKNKLYFGDNLPVLRESIDDESVDLIYLDPPFNSNATYNVLFKTPKGHGSAAQIEAFEDTWHWGEQTAAAYSDLMQQPNTDVAEAIRALRSVLGENDMIAYLTMMAVRLLELHRILKPTGSLYLHCDPTASHYLKIVLDGIFGSRNYRNEISWKRSSAHSDTKQGMKRCGKVRDVLFFYSKSDEYTWNTIYTPYSKEYLESEYRHVTPDGRRYKETDLTAAKPGGDTEYEWRVKRTTGNGERWQADLEDEYKQPRPDWVYQGVRPYNGRFWAYSRANLVQFVTEKRIIHRETGIPRLMQFADEMPGIPLQDNWDDIPPASGSEDLGYATQKPLDLLERVIRVSSNEGDVVLDPFCGCGTTIHAAQELRRQWIGIDVTHLAISLIEKRLKDHFPGIEFEVHGTPKDLEGASNLAMRDKYQFQWWACSLVNAQPFGGKKKGADSGIDGLIFFQHDAKQTGKIVVSVKGGDNVGVGMVRDLGHVVEREKAAMGLLVTLAPPSRPMITEAAGAGFYTSPINGVSFPKLQILMIEGLLNGTERARYPHLDQGGLTFRKVTRDSRSAAQGDLFEGPSVPTAVLERRMAVVCTLVNRLADQPNFGRTKMAKLFYLADATENLELGTTYDRKAAGPLDTVALYNVETGLEAFAVRHRYLGVKQTGKKITYSRGPNLESALDNARKVLGKKRGALNRLIDRFRPLDTDQCEIVATLYACWNDLLLDGKDASEGAVVEEFLEAWHESKRRFPRERLLKALAWMKENQIVPKGRGAHTRVAPVGRRPQR